MISTALRAAAAFVDINATVSMWDPHQRLTDEQRCAKGEKIKAVAAELRTLADTSERTKVAYREYKALKDQLYAFGVALPLTLEQDVAVAFREADGPATPRGPNWLRAQSGA